MAKLETMRSKLASGYLSAHVPRLYLYTIADTFEGRVEQGDVASFARLILCTPNIDACRLASGQPVVYEKQLVLARKKTNIIVIRSTGWQRIATPLRAFGQPLTVCPLFQRTNKLPRYIPMPHEKESSRRLIAGSSTTVV
jgi:hypothetical protein